MPNQPKSAASGRTEAAAQKRVFIDSDVLTALEPAPDRRHDARRVIGSGVADAVRLLRESHDVVVITSRPLADIAELRTLPTAVTIPDGFPAGSWYITSDESWCEGERPAGLRSILVGPRRPPARRPTLRCDFEARDMAAAVMEILVRETMA